MNILFIDCNDNIQNKYYKFLYDKIGFYLKQIKNKDIYFLNINTKKKSYFILNKFIKYIFNKNKVYLTLSKEVENNIKLKQIIKTNLLNFIFVSNQNNLYDNDKLYINEYLKNNNLDISKIKVLVVIDELELLQKRKIEELIQKYKIVDICSNNINGSVVKYVDEINNKYGTVVEVIDKYQNGYYNILLVFSKKYKVTQTEDSFILDYNNSDLDKKSNTYLIFKNNEKQFQKIFKNLDIEISRFEKTKLGKLYIHASRLILDI